jgi:spore maturation protein CgeB
MLKVLQYCTEDRATSWQRTMAFNNLNVNLTVDYHSKDESIKRNFISLIYSIFHRLGFPIARKMENSKLLKLVTENKFDIIFIEKCLVIRPSTLKKIKELNPHSKIVCYILDDFLGKGNRSFFFMKSIKYYDLIACNKEHNVQKYYYYGAKKVYYFKNAYSKLVHRPIAFDKESNSYFSSDVTFIGTYEKIRADYLLFLANNGIKVKVWGWSKSSKSSGIDHPLITNMGKHVYFDEFPKVICSSKISLNFLRKSNKDTETTRSIEIPACGGFMLAERTENHMLLFEEGSEAEYFDSKEELLSKIKYYLVNEIERTEIGKRALQRCEKDDYSYERQLTLILNQL